MFSPCRCSRSAVFWLFLLAVGPYLPAVGQSFVPERHNPKLKVAPAGPVQAYGFALRDVRLLDSPFKAAMLRDEQYLLSLEPDRLLHRFRLNAGLPPKAPLYGGWESQGVSGHSLGHYLSACALAYAATGDARFKQRVDYLVAGLAECQARRCTGYVGGIPKEDSIFAEVAQGRIHSSGFDLNGGWVPWYTVHKVLAGLEDAYLYADNQQAKGVALKFGDWVGREVSGLSENQMQQMLACEHGGMAEALVNLYAFTGNKKYRDLSYRFNHQAILGPLAAGLDELAGQHANTQIPKILGQARQYELTGDAQARRTAAFFWQAMVGGHSYVIGGNSDFEHLSPPGQLSEHLSANTTETCNTYNMLKLTRHLFGWQPSAALTDYYERALYNHILASQNPETGMTAYYVSLAMGGQKVFGTPTESFWCCTGTGMENHVKYGENIYAQGRDGSLYVNLFIPSELNWTEKGVRVRQQTRFPASDTVRLNVQTRRRRQFALRLRRPAWAGEAMQLRVNGQPVPATPAADGYVVLDRNWRDGDRVEVVFAQSLHAEAMPDNARRVALLYGPLVLAGQLGQATPDPVEGVPVLITDKPQLTDWVRPVADQPLTFRTAGAGRPADVTLVPFYQVYNQHYTVYFDRFTAEEWTRRKAAYEAEKARRLVLDARSVDVVRLGEMQPERDHHLRGQNTTTGEAFGRKWRDARDGGNLIFEAAVDPRRPNGLLVTYWGDDDNRLFDFYVDDVLVATQELKHSRPHEFFDVEYAVPPTLTEGKQQVTVKVQARPGSTAGGLFGFRTVRR